MRFEVHDGESDNDYDILLGLSRRGRCRHYISSETPAFISESTPRQNQEQRN